MKTQWIQNLRVGGLVFLMSLFFPVLAFASTTIGHAIDDTVITAKVKSSFAINDITSNQNISVTTNNGVVTLSGTVDSQTQATAAIDITRQTEGVKSIDSQQLTVRESHQFFKDVYITAKVKAALLSHNLNVTVETQNGVVYLSGFVKDSTQSESAVQLAHAVEGVVSVKSDLAIKS